ncbi:Scr1 family TA system antitoxin-like transcriptional regulator [Streptomyces sp. NPDC047072]|uniref:helix-turn-helix domain-containing protein n=1 Tax=Streptomyces sp. NPDC047072 TaxID=3154809 RepID=UPI0033E1C7E9
MAIEDNPLTRQQYGAELKRRREAAGLTQEELSVRAVMSRTHIAHIEAGRRRPDVEDARRLDQVLESGGFFENFLPALDGRRVAEHFAEALEFEGRATEIRVYALPFSVGYHSLMEGFVSLMWFEDLPPIAYAEGLKSGRILELPSVVRECQVAYDHALGDALSHRKSLEMLRSIAEDYEHEAQRTQHP